MLDHFLLSYILQQIHVNYVKQNNGYIIIKYRFQVLIERYVFDLNTSPNLFYLKFFFFK